MEPITWTGSVGVVLNPLLGIAFGLLIISALLMMVASFVAPPQVSRTGRALRQTSGGIFGVVVFGYSFV